MKKSILIGFTLVGILFAFHASAQSNSEESITHFAATVELHSDATVAVTERIIYNFGTNERHGIYRNIPVSYQTTLGKTSIKLSNIKVTDENGRPYEFETSTNGSDKEIKIGNADVLVTGTRTYVISYTVARAAGYFRDYDELYWNVTGTGWQVPIEDASVEIILPIAIAKKDIRAACYVGAYGSTNPCVSYTVGVSNEATDDTNHLYFASTALLAGEGFTAAVGFPKGIIYEPTKWERILQTASDNWVVLLPFLVLGIMYYLWRKYGKDETGRGVVIAEYESPDSLSPVELSALQNGMVKNNALSAEIVYLATKGYLTIQHIKKDGLLFKADDYELTKRKDSSDLSKVDQLLLDGIFTSDTVKLSELKNKFYKNISGIKKAAMDVVLAKKYYTRDPQQVKGLYIAAGIAFGFIFTMVGAATEAGALHFISGLVSAAVIVGFAFVMPKLTKEGAIAREKTEGLKLYMDVAEKDRINFHNAPEKNPQLFEKLLPFAMVLGVEAAWAKQFEGIYTQPPSWYSDSTGHAFNSLYFANSLNSFSDSARSTLVSAPSGGSGSGGGGFSGGGMGGGGGGSW